MRRRFRLASDTENRDRIQSRVGGAIADALAQYFYPWPIGRRVAGLPASSPQHAHPTGAREIRYFIRDSSLADTGFAADQKYLSMPLQSRRESCDQFFALLRTADECRQRRAREKFSLIGRG